MRFLRLAAMIVAITGGYLGLAGGSASATPLSSGALAPSAAHATANPLAEKSQFYFGGGPYRRYRRPYYARPYYRYRRPYYARPVYRPRVVCRVRYGYYGPRRVCVRRF